MKIVNEVSEDDRLTKDFPDQENAKTTPPVPPPVAKRVFDKSLALILLVLSSPVWLLISLAIIVEGIVLPRNRGPLVHVEERVSAGRGFKLYKFRILIMTAVYQIHNEGAVPKTVENNRANLTNTGWLLKKIGLDELPQLIDILAGDMSFVGPRPKPTAEYQAELDQGVRSRSLVQAGLTGPAQVMKGTKRTIDQQRAADSNYVALLRSSSALKIVWFDIRILGKTVKVMFKATGE